MRANRTKITPHFIEELWGMFRNDAPVNMVTPPIRYSWNQVFSPPIINHILLPPTTTSDRADDASCFCQSPTSLSLLHICWICHGSRSPAITAGTHSSAHPAVNLLHLRGLTFALILGRRRWFVCQLFRCTETHLLPSHSGVILHRNAQRTDAAWTSPSDYRLLPPACYRLKKIKSVVQTCLYLPEDGVYCVSQETFPRLRRQEFGSEDGHELVEVHLAVTWQPKYPTNTLDVTLIGQLVVYQIL